MDWKGRFLAGTFSEADGTPSFSRVISAFAAFFSFGWVTAILWVHLRRGVEPALPDFMGLIAFIGVFYGINKGADVLSKFSGK